MHTLTLLLVLIATFAAKVSSEHDGLVQLNTPKLIPRQADSSSSSPSKPTTSSNKPAGTGGGAADSSACSASAEAILSSYYAKPPAVPTELQSFYESQNTAVATSDLPCTATFPASLSDVVTAYDSTFATYIQPFQTAVSEFAAKCSGVTPPLEFCPDKVTFVFTGEGGQVQKTVVQGNPAATGAAGSGGKNGTNGTLGNGADGGRRGDVQGVKAAAAAVAGLSVLVALL